MLQFNAHLEWLANDRNPENINEFYNLGRVARLSMIANQTIFKHLVTDHQGAQAVIIYHPQLAQVVKSSNELVVDGTFKSVPLLFYQLLTIGSFQDGFVSTYILYSHINLILILCFIIFQLVSSLHFCTNGKKNGKPIQQRLSCYCWSHWTIGKYYAHLLQL